MMLSVIQEVALNTGVLPFSKGKTLQKLMLLICWLAWREQVGNWGNSLLVVVAAAPICNFCDYGSRDSYI
jgi:hypothetical protein